MRNSWTRVVKRMSIPPATKEAIMSVGLMGATGIVDIDGLTVELIPIEGVASSNLVINGDFELGDPAPFAWHPEKDAKRVFPGFNSHAAVELRGAKSRLLTGLAIPVAPFQALDITMAVQCSGLRGAGGAAAGIFFSMTTVDRWRGMKTAIALLSMGRNFCSGGLTTPMSMSLPVRAGLCFRSISSTRSGRSASTTYAFRPRPTPLPARGCHFKSPMTRTAGWP